MIIGRQVRTPYNTYVDLLAMDVDGDVHVLELKRDKTPRDVVAQVLDYGSWISTLDRDAIIAVATEYLREPFEAAFGRAFDDAPVPDDINTDLELTVVASSLDPSSERIVTYLREFGVPINVVFFSFLEDEDRQYLARSWLAPAESADAVPSPGGTKKGKRAQWNGQDWYVNFGDGLGRSWEDGRKYGFISAGGGEWYSRTLRNLPEGARVNVYLPQRGYVAVGTTLRTAVTFDKAEVWIQGTWQSLASLPLQARYRHDREDSFGEDLAEYAIPVEWSVAVPEEEAYRETGMFASTHSACKLRQDFTLQKLADHFGLNRENP